MIGKKKDKEIEADMPPEETIPAGKKQKGSSGKKPKAAEDEKPLEEIQKKPKISMKSLKRAIIGLLLLAIAAAAGFTAYTSFFARETGRHYVAKELPHITLPPEMMKFIFENIPELYDNFLMFDIEITLLDREIKRIETIGSTYPDQAGIATDEARVWESLRKSSAQSFEKIENRVKDLYVTFQVNQKSGMARLDEEKAQLAADAKEILDPLTALTQGLKRSEEVPQGYIRQTIYKFKKLFT